MTPLDVPAEALDLSKLSPSLRHVLRKLVDKGHVKTLRDLLAFQLPAPAREDLRRQATEHARSEELAVFPATGRESQPFPGSRASPEEVAAWLTTWGLQSLFDRTLLSLVRSFQYRWHLDEFSALTVREFFARRRRNGGWDAAHEYLSYHFEDLVERVEEARDWLADAENEWDSIEIPPPFRVLVGQYRADLRHLLTEHSLIDLPTHPPTVELQELSIDGRTFRLNLDGKPELYGSGTSGPTDHVAALAGAIDFLVTPSRDRDAVAARYGQPKWARTLHDLRDRVTVAPDTDDKKLLGWRVDPEEGQLTPLRCRRTKRGTYQTRRVRSQEIPRALATEPGDRDLLDACETSGAHLRLDRLVGHPRVFLGKGNVAMPVRRGRLQLGVRSVEGGHRLQLELNDHPLDDDVFTGLLGGMEPGYGVHVDDDTLYVVRTDGPTKHLLRGIRFFLGTVFPPEATAQLLALLPDLASSVPMATDPTMRGKAVGGDDRPLVRLDWSGTDLTVAMRVRPLVEATPEVPGRGAETVLALRDDGVVHVQRDLDEEIDRLGLLASTLHLDDARAHGFEWVLTDRDRALQVVRALQDNADAVRVAWNGDRVKVLQEATMADLSIRVRKRRDWLGLEGGITVDGDKVPLDQLLRAALEGHGHVQVASGAWVAIEATLGQALATAASVGDAKSGDLSILHAPVLELLEAEGATVDGATDWRDLAARVATAQTLDAPVPDGVNATLRPYQVEGFKWLAALASWAPGACLADDMGLGKTLQTLCLLQRLASEGPALVVAPTSVCINWQREAARFTPDLRIVPYRGSRREALLDDLGPGDVVVTSYGLLIRDEVLLERDWRVAVLDEAQAIKNPSTARAKAATSLKADFRLALSGTPVENHTGELYSLMAFVAPGLLGRPAGFRERFVVPIDAKGDRQRRALLARIVGPFLLRRTKRNVASELPDRVEQIYRVEPSDAERALYERTRLEAVVRAQMPNAKRMQILAELQRLRQLACHPRLLDPSSPVPSSKLRAVTRVLNDLREAGHRALVFSSFTRHLGLVREALEAEGFQLRYLDGSTPIDARQREVDAFQDGQGDAFLISLKAGGTGLNLTAATYVIHLDPWWNPAAEDQATDRAHRIGQSQKVTVYRMVTVGTIEEQIVALHQDKRDLAEALLSGSGEATRITSDDLLALLQEASAPSELASLEVELSAPAPEQAPDPAPMPEAATGKVLQFPGPAVSPPAASSPQPAPSQPSEAATSTAADWVARFTVEQVEPSALKPASKRAYLGALQRMVDERAPAEALASEDAVAFFEGLRAEVKAGQIGSKSDKVYGSPAITRIATWLRTLDEHDPP